MLRKPKRSNPRYTDDYNDFRRTVLKRDRYRCQMPGCKRRSRLQVHHIIRFADSIHGRLNTSNGLTLCFKCHESIKNREGHYINLFLKIAEQNESRKKRP